MEEEKKGLTLNQETMDVLVANIISTTKYFESRFDHKQYQIDQRINNIALNIEKITATQKVTLRDYIIERDRYYDGKFNNLRNFNIAIITLIAGVIIKVSGLI